MVIFTEQYKIIPPSDEDYKHLEELYNDSIVMRYIPNALKHWESKLLREKVLKYQKNDIGIHIIKSNENQFIGEASIFHFKDTADTYEIGFILHKSYWGKGLGTLICSSLIKYSIEVLNAKTVVARIIKNNLASQKVCIKSGMILLNETIEDIHLNRLTFSFKK